MKLFNLSGIPLYKQVFNPMFTLAAGEWTSVIRCQASLVNWFDYKPWVETVSYISLVAPGIAVVKFKSGDTVVYKGEFVF
jgi:hypothetical protein